MHYCYMILFFLLFDGCIGKVEFKDRRCYWDGTSPICEGECGDCFCTVRKSITGDSTNPCLFGRGRKVYCCPYGIVTEGECYSTFKEQAVARDYNTEQHDQAFKKWNKCTGHHVTTPEPDCRWIGVAGYGQYPALDCFGKCKDNECLVKESYDAEHGNKCYKDRPIRCCKKHLGLCAVLTFP